MNTKYDDMRLHANFAFRQKVGNTQSNRPDTPEALTRCARASKFLCISTGGKEAVQSIQSLRFNSRRITFD